MVEGPPPRYRFIHVGPHRVLRVDHTGLSPLEHIRALDSIRDFIMQGTADSLLLLTLCNDRFTSGSAAAVNAYSRSIDPFVRANAVVCRPGFRAAFNALLNALVRHEVSCFETEADAVAWLGALATAGQRRNVSS